MQSISKLYDFRINANNILMEIDIKDYLGLAKMILDKNEFQRSRVKKSETIYSLLKEDLKEGCIIPPLVLALYDSTSSDIKGGYDELKSHSEKGNILILDGLQRTHTLLDLEQELKEKKDSETLDSLYKRKIRIEVYVGVNRLGLLYRMLTLNTGQTTVSLRHQIEILYLDLLNQDIEGIKLVREVDDKALSKLSEYKFKDAVEGFNSYLDRSELPFDRFELLDNIKSLEKLSKENRESDLFKEYLITFNMFVTKIDDLSKHWEFSEKYEKKLISTPFGRNIQKIFGKSQAMTGFGAAIGKLVDFNIVKNFKEVRDSIENLSLTRENIDNAFFKLLKNLDEIRNTSKKIGNAQRMFFHYFFRELFNEEGDSYLKIELAVDNGYEKYRSQTV